MPVPTRPTKGTSGTQSYANDTLILASELNDESVALFGAFSNLDDSNIAAGANVDPSKIGDYSDSAAEQKTVSDPGTGSSLSAPTTLEGEIERLRYAIERLATGLDGTAHAKRYDGSANVDVSWSDRPARGDNLAVNGSFEVKQSATAADPPDSWAAVGTVTSAALAATDAAEGGGRMLTVTTGAVSSGVAQTLTKLRASTRYLVSVRAKVTGGTAQLVTVGADATSQFRDITLATTSGTFTTLAAVVQTDATPTALVVRLLGAGNGDVVHFDHVCVQECTSLPAPAPTSFTAVSASTASLNLAVGVWTDLGLSCVVVPPLPGYQIEVTAKINIFFHNATFIAVRIREQKNADAPTEVDVSFASNPAGHSDCIASTFIRKPADSGATYTYTVEAYPVDAAATLNSYGAYTYNQRSTLTAKVCK